ncbi:hypothetical protein L917_08920 [Phytophthora nicotianae]|uniref:Uncharacterized protein n=1 Tax=Phytophthora nicotianae TaxID=4792 RepID=W2L5Y9_PHYNI|nr:hypothetical protein L917_08920 [Phytophthora nicotianae]
MVNDDRIILPGYHNDPRTALLDFSCFSSTHCIRCSYLPRAAFFTSMVLQAMSTFLSQPYP